MIKDFLFMRKLICFLFLFCVIQLHVLSQNVKNEVVNTLSNSAGTSMAYKFEFKEYTPPPEGFAPFYINHLGRHGSRNHTSENLFPGLAEIFKQASEHDILTAKGKEVKYKIDKINNYMEKRYGDLSLIGQQEQREIAERMINNYPEIFLNNDCKIDAKSTLVPRCILSMSFFSLKLKEHNPLVDISMESSDFNNAYLNYYNKEYREYYENGSWRELLNDFQNDALSPDRFIASLFKTDTLFKDSDKMSFMKNLWSANAIMKASGINHSFYDIFTEDEIFALWQVQNLNQYLRKGPSGINDNIAIIIAKPMLKNFIETSVNAIENRNLSANLRFAHGESIIPFTALIGIKDASKIESNPSEVYLAWNDYKVSPMSANIQWVFYENSQSEILIKVLHNEHEVSIPVETSIYPYYKWEDVLDYYSSLF